MLPLMATDVIPRHMGAENERREAAEALEASWKIVAGSLVEGEGEGECPELAGRCWWRHRLALAGGQPRRQVLRALRRPRAPANGQAQGTPQ